MAEFLVAPGASFHPSLTAVGGWLLLAVLLIGIPLYAFTGAIKGLTRRR